MTSTFKQATSFEKRKSEAARIHAKYPELVPIICERATGNKDIPEIDKKKYLVPPDLTISQFSYVIRKRMKLDAQKAIFLTIGNRLPVGHKLVSEVYSEHQDEDGFLYITYAAENTFG